MNPVVMTSEPHPLLDLAAFSISHNSQSASGSPQRFLSMHTDVIEASPFDIHLSESRYAEVKSSVRDLLRHGGYKPTGRGKPASEYLVKAVSTQKLGPINPTVDTLNAVSLHSCLPISVVDLAKCKRTKNDFRVAIAPTDTSYVFNSSGQAIKLDGLLCLFDDEGPCANAVKDSQRTKIDHATEESLVLIWGTKELQSHSGKTATWFRELITAQAIGETGDAVLR